jgi:hypothetical protein
MTTRTTLALLLLAGLCACPSALEPPRAVIRAGSSLDIEDDDDCEGDATTRIETAVGSAAALHAACSRDPSGLTLSYHWQIVDQPNGSAIELPNDAVISPTVIPDLPGRYALSLIVSNGTLTSAATTVAIDAE